MPSIYPENITHKDAISGWCDMEREILLGRIPNIAAQLFALGILFIVVSAVLTSFVQSGLQMLGFAIGFGLLSIGQRIGERAMDADR
jgi:hypothetical protein